MSLYDIERSKALRKYCAMLGREGIAKRIIEIAEEIVKQEGAYQSTMKNAGKIRALCIGSKVDSYWDEKQSMGMSDMFHEAEMAIFKSSKEDGMP